MVVFAPISTSMPTTTPPTCGTFTQAPLLRRETEAVAADDGAGLHDAARAEPARRGRRNTRATSRESSPMTARLPITHAGADVAARADQRAFAHRRVRRDLGRRVDPRAGSDRGRSDERRA